ncbi:MAG: hypothetical protein KAT34_22395 [Candidatus Aminicenantes bacterium]|nr:hypothetical protein [Candidatus Aminicenantes bacterium]
MRVEKDFKEFIELLNKNKVKYLIVGGYAFAFYAEPRFTKDIDFFVEISETNAENIAKTLVDFGFESTAVKKDYFQIPGKIIQLGYSPMRIDIITSITGVALKDAWKNKKKGKYGDASCYFISKEDLKKNKKAAGRSKDIADLELLEKI